MITVLLLDLDGVLVRPGGYRAAVHASLAYTFGRWGWELPIPEDLPAQFEAVGITSEWDMVPLTLAAALDAWAMAHGRVPSPKVLEAHGPSPGAWGRAPLPDYASVPRRLAEHLEKGVAPSSRAWHLQSTPAALFPALGRSALAQALLTNTRSVFASPVTRLFQQFVLGNELFAEVYGLPAEIKTPSLLKMHDKPLLGGAALKRLREKLAQGSLKAAVLTARPSVPKATPRGTGNSPEAELALSVAGLRELPVLGFGHLDFFARQRGFGDGERLLKPAAFHAMAAMFAALGFSVEEALELAEKWALENQPQTDALPGDGVRLVGVEDTSTGLRAVLAAAKLLREQRVPVQPVLLGVATHPDKRRGLEAVGAKVYPTTEAALSALDDHALSPD